jgi:hypothetical protein
MPLVNDWEWLTDEPDESDVEVSEDSDEDWEGLDYGEP